MTKTQLSVRINPDTLATIDALAQQQGVSRGHIVDKWLSKSAAAATRDMQQWHKVHELLEQANDYITAVDNGYGSQAQVVAALRCIVSAISTQNDSPAGGQWPVEGIGRWTTNRPTRR